ncbi:hypothetical protein TrLO_g11999 [Triparma laevis f. longispina]|nr:hypothetical protein TrLO_g11999 [Triparma laevis f. longispina]
MKNVTITKNNKPLTLSPKTLSSLPSGTLLKIIKPLLTTPPPSWRSLNPPYGEYIVKRKQIQKKSNSNTYKTISNSNRPKIPLRHETDLSVCTIKQNCGESLTGSGGSSILIGRKNGVVMDVVSHLDFVLSDDKKDVKKLKKLIKFVEGLKLEIVGVSVHGSIDCDTVKEFTTLKSLLSLSGVNVEVVCLLNDSGIEGISVSSQLCQLLWDERGRLDEGKVKFSSGVEVNDEIRREVDYEVFYKFVGLKTKEGGWFKNQQGRVRKIEDVNGLEVLRDAWKKGFEEVCREVEKGERGRRGRVGEEEWKRFLEWYEDR